MQRVKTNDEFEYIMTLTKIDNVKFNQNEIIILLDEIDKCEALLIDGHSEPKTENTNTPEKVIVEINRKDDNNEEKKIYDKLNLGVVLSRLDGIGEYGGMIIIATANDITKLNPALYRNLRLSPIEFNYLRNVDISKLIEKFYNIKLSSDEISKLPDRNTKIAPTDFITLMLKYNKSELIDYLHKRRI